MSAHVLLTAVMHEGHLRFDERAYRQQLRRMQLEDGEEAQIRIERPEDAYTYGQIKHYWGHLVTPFCEYTGYTHHEAHLMLKALYLPDGKTSITELCRDELKAYTESCEQYLREEVPEAWDRACEVMSLYQRTA